MELIFADLEIINRRLPKIEKKAQLKVELDAEAEYQVLSKLKMVLESGKFARFANLTPKDLSILKPYNFLTMKPMIYVCNVDETEAFTENIYIQEVKKYAEKEGTGVVVISAKIEEEVSALDVETRKMFLDELGIKESGLDKLTKKAYDLLGLATFFTAGEKEARAWTFKKGMKANECAGIIHSDFERGFIRAEIITMMILSFIKVCRKLEKLGKCVQKAKTIYLKMEILPCFALMYRRLG